MRIRSGTSIYLCCFVSTTSPSLCIQCFSTLVLFHFTSLDASWLDRELQMGDWDWVVFHILSFCTQTLLLQRLFSWGRGTNNVNRRLWSWVWHSLFHLLLGLRWEESQTPLKHCFFTWWKWLWWLFRNWRRYCRDNHGHIVQVAIWRKVL